MSYLATRGFLDGRMQAGGIDHHAELLQVMRMAELMQRERLIDRRGLAHDIDRAVDGLLGQFQREGRFGGDLCASAITKDGSSAAARRD